MRRIATDTQEIQGGTVDTTSTNVVGIIFNTGQGAGICSGSLIAPNLVLTARHCVGPTNTTQCSTNSFGAAYSAGAFRVTTSYNAAANTLNSGIWPNVNNSTWFGAAQIILPTTPANNICGGDIALIRLTTNITNICPPIPRVDQAVGQNEAYTAVGFGRLSPTGTTSGTRYTVSGVNVLCAGNCGGGTDGAREWIGGSSAARGVCEGDSGGPALDSRRRVLGVVSRGGAGSCNQAVYVGTFGQAAWIKSVALQAASAGGYAAPGWANGDTTTYNPCPGATDGGVPTGGGGGSTGGGGGSTGGGGGSTTTECSNGTICVDATGAGDLTCVTPNYTIPAGSASCGQTTGCAVGYSCWQTSSTSAVCLQDCSTPSTGGGPGGGGGAATGGGGGSSNPGGPCTESGTSCVNASGAGDYACLSTTSASGIPANAPRCSQTTPC
ncbi:MAG TPA: trypsin-like serine protease, partial [Archangium sp.]